MESQHAPFSLRYETNQSKIWFTSAACNKMLKHLRKQIKLKCQRQLLLIIKPENELYCPEGYRQITLTLQTRNMLEMITEKIVYFLEIIIYKGINCTKTRPLHNKIFVYEAHGSKKVEKILSYTVDNGIPQGNVIRPISFSALTGLCF